MGSILRSKYVRVLTLALAGQSVLFYSASHGESTPLALPLDAFPNSFGNWRLRQVGYVDKEQMDILRADDTLTRIYRDQRAEASLFIAYFKTQRTGQSPHSPKNCLPGSGWQPDEDTRIDVPVGGQSIRINRYVVSKGSDQDITFYWYQSQGRVVASEFAAKYFLVRDSIVNHRSDSALIRIIVAVPPGRRDVAEQVGLDFVKASYPVIKAYLPQ